MSTTSLKPGEYAASVHRIIDGDEYGRNAKTWACEMIGYKSWESAAKAAAETWWEDTDQSGDCKVDIALTDHRGERRVYRVIVSLTVVAQLHESIDG